MRKVILYISCLLSCFPYTSKKELLIIFPVIEYDHHRDKFISFSVPIIQRYIQDQNKSMEISSYIWEASQIYEIDPYLMLGLFEIESGFRNDLTSKAGARGIGQVMPYVYNDIINRTGIVDNDDIQTHIYVATICVKELTKRKGSLPEVLKFYGGFKNQGKLYTYYYNSATKYITYD